MGSEVKPQLSIEVVLHAGWPGLSHTSGEVIDECRELIAREVSKYSKEAAQSV